MFPVRQGSWFDEDYYCKLTGSVKQKLPPGLVSGALSGHVSRSSQVPVSQDQDQDQDRRRERPKSEEVLHTSSCVHALGGTVGSGWTFPRKLGGQLESGAHRARGPSGIEHNWRWMITDQAALVDS